ncbi:MAG: pseudouridine synthase, partial [Rickettsiales bacterium]|nr:pseudouridine synthase [Rickettsiales bacterium]
DGKLANFIAHPSTAWKRTYRIKVHGFWEKIDFSKCEKYGLKVDGIKYAPFKAVVEKESNTTNVWLKITLTEGKNREARKIMEYFHLTVMKLIRISFGSFNLGGLREGELKPVPDKVLKSVVGNKLPTLWAQN